MFHNQARIKVSDASGIDETSHKSSVSQRKLAGRHATSDDLLQNLDHAFIMLPNAGTFLNYGRFNQIVQLAVGYAGVLTPPTSRPRH